MNVCKIALLLNVVLYMRWYGFLGEGDGGCKIAERAVTKMFMEHLTQ